LGLNGIKEREENRLRKGKLPDPNCSKERKCGREREQEKEETTISFFPLLAFTHVSASKPVVRLFTMANFYGFS
jgi:hypothetical protein